MNPKPALPAPLASPPGSSPTPNSSVRPPTDRVGLGRWGENLAAEFVTDLGWTLVERNWRCARGEIDLVALDGDVLVVCEVKTRSSARYGTAIEAVHPRKIARLRVLCGLWLEEHKDSELSFSQVRLDVVAVTLAASGIHIEHLAWVG